MSTSCDLTFVMATYNRQHWLPRAMHSLVRQSLPVKEILVVDDASTDSTWDMLQEWSRQDDRIRIFRRPQNSGGYHGMLLNELLEKCRTEWYMPHSDDDSKRFECIETLWDFTGDNDIVYGDSQQHNCSFNRSQDWDPKLIRKRNYVDIGEAIVRTSVWRTLDGYDETLIGATDWEFWIRVGSAGFRVHHVKKYVTDYYFHDGMMTRRSDHQTALASIIKKHNL